MRSEIDKKDLVFLGTLTAVLLTLLWFSGAENARNERNLTPEREIEVSCETPQGWVTYKSYIPQARNGRGGWYITTVDGQVVRASNCVTSYPKEWR